MKEQKKEKKEDFAGEIKKAIQSEPAVKAPVEKGGVSPPVFVKVERYGELLEDVNQLRSYSLGMRDALDALSEIEKELKAAMNLTAKVLDKVNMVISSIDMKLLKKSGPVLSAETETIRPPLEVESNLKEIYDQIERLKGELKTIS